MKTLTSISPKLGALLQMNLYRRVGLSLIIMLFSFFGFEKAQGQSFSNYSTSTSAWTVKASPGASFNAPSVSLGTVASSDYAFASDATGNYLSQFLITGSWSSVAGPGANFNNATVAVAGFGGSSTSLYLMGCTASGSFFSSRTSAGVYTTKASPGAGFYGATSLAMFSTGTTLYAIATTPTGVTFSSYSVASDTWTVLASPGASFNGAKVGLVTMGTTNVYVIGSTSSGTFFSKYTGGAWTTLASPGATFDGSSVALNADALSVYAISSNATGAYFSKYSTLSSSWSTLTSPGAAFSNSTIGLANVGTTSFYALATTPPVAACTTPIATATATQATCASNVANSNGTLVLNTFDANAKKVDYNIGSTYTGAGFAGAATVGTAPFTVASTLPNPSFNQPYTIRIFCDATTYIDKTVILMPKQCQIADLSLAFSPLTQTGNAGEYLTFTATVTNAGPDVATNVKVAIPMPEPKATLLSATTTFGTYNAVSKQWLIPSLPVGTATMTFTVKVN
jgi:large repetitive protein